MDAMRRQIAMRILPAGIYLFFFDQSANSFRLMMGQGRRLDASCRLTRFENPCLPPTKGSQSACGYSTILESPGISPVSPVTVLGRPIAPSAPIMGKVYLTPNTNFGLFRCWICLFLCPSHAEVNETTCNVRDKRY